MLDTIQFSGTKGNLTKTVQHVEIVQNDAMELAALQAQLAAFEQGEQNAEITAAIANYQAQIAFLQGL